MNFNMINLALIASSFLISKSKQGNRHNLPNFRNILEVKHYIPGRLRLSCNYLKQNSKDSMLLVDTFKKIPGINNITINEQIGTILVEYDFNSLEPVLILGIILKVLNLENEVKENPKSLLSKESINVLDSVNRSINEKTIGILDFKNLVMLFIGAYAIYDIKARPEIRPCGYTCLWWIYSSLIDKF